MWGALPLKVIFEHNTVRPGGAELSWGNNIDNYSGKCAPPSLLEGPSLPAHTVPAAHTLAGRGHLPPSSTHDTVTTVITAHHSPRAVLCAARRLLPARLPRQQLEA